MRLILVLCLLPLPLCAQPAILVAPVFGQLVAFAPPPGFHDGDEIVNGASYLHEIVPKGETVADWSQMVTLSGGKGMATADPQADAEGFAQSMAAGYNAACPDSFTAVGLDAPPIQGARAVFAAYLGCGDNGAGQSEAVAFFVMVGRQDIYTLQWAEHGPKGGAPSFDPAHWYPRLQILSAEARICDRADESPPYPSCTD